MLLSAGLYSTFLILQTGRHRGYFTLGDAAELHVGSGGSTAGHAIALIAYLAMVVYLAEKLAAPIDYVVETLHAPAGYAGVIVAVLVATPEALGATRAAMANQIQRSVNIFLGSVLSTIGLTIPFMLAITHFTGRPIELGVQHTDVVMLLLTLAVSVVTFSSGRTNVLQGAVHLLLFVAYLFLLVQS